MWVAPSLGVLAPPKQRLSDVDPVSARVNACESILEAHGARRAPQGQRRLVGTQFSTTHAIVFLVNTGFPNDRAL